MPMSTRRSGWLARPSRSSRTTSLADRVRTASLTTSAPVPRIARYRPSRSLGVPSKSCIDNTMLRPCRSAISASKPPRHSRSTHSAPSSSARRRMPCRSSSDPLNRPPSHTGRQVTTTGQVRSASAPARSRSRTVSSLSSTRSASHAASRRARSSSVVSPVTVAHSWARRIRLTRQEPLQPGAGEALVLAVCVGCGQAGRRTSPVLSNPRYHRQDDTRPPGVATVCHMRFTGTCCTFTLLPENRELKLARFAGPCQISSAFWTLHRPFLLDP